MMKYLAATDEKRNCQEARAPENSETANMVNLGIKLLQKLAKQPPPSNYASINRNTESAMAATPDSESSVEKARY